MARIFIGSADGTKVIKRDSSSIWQQRGWKRDGSKYTGHYKTNKGYYEGEAEKDCLGNFQMFIIEPPYSLKKHPHWVCFNHIEKSKFSVHFSFGLKDLDSGIMRIETVLNESFRLAG